MFNKSHIGQRVISTFWGKGVISEFDVTKSIAIGVMFDKYKVSHNYNQGLKVGPDAYFYADGRCCIHEDDKDYNITMYEPVDLLQEEENDPH